MHNINIHNEPKRATWQPYTSWLFIKPWKIEKEQIKKPSQAFQVSPNNTLFKYQLKYMNIPAIHGISINIAEVK